ncbi:MAG: acyl-CoA thioesterase [Beijerinckiaceae bacterium]
MFVARRERLIEWGDCDPARIVFNPRYFEWFDACTAHVFAAAGLSKASLFETYGFAGWPLVATRAKFLKASRFGQTVMIESSVISFRRSSFDVQHKLFNADELAVEASETRVWTIRHPDDPERLKAAAVPQDVVARLSR